MPNIRPLLALLLLAGCQAPAPSRLSATAIASPSAAPTATAAATTTPAPDTRPSPGTAGQNAAGPNDLPADPGTPEPYRYLGRAHYEGKPLLGTEGEFAQLAIAPGGRQVAFVGRDAMEAYQLLLADLDGPVRHLAPAGLEPQRLALTTDALVYQTLVTSRETFRPGTPPEVPGLPVGVEIHRLALADGGDRRVAALPRFGVAFPDPTGAQVALWAFTPDEPSKAGAPLGRLDVATGERHPLLPDAPLPTYLDGAWSPDGRAFAFAVPGLLRAFRAPAWTPQDLPRAGSGAFWWDAEGTAFEGTTLGVDGGLALESFGPGSDEATFLALPPPATGEVWPSPARTRYLVHREDGNWLGERGTGKFRAIAPGLTPLGWLDEARFLAYAGRDQRKTLAVVAI